MPVTTRLKRQELPSSTSDSRLELEVQRTARMTTHTDTVPMDIDFGKLPTAIDTNNCPVSPGKSDSGDSDKSTLSYTDDFETLPSSGPTSHAHIIDLREYATSMKVEGILKLQDAIATTLFNVSLATLRSFVNPTVNAFKAVFGTKDVQLVIWRKGLEVFVSRHIFC